MQFTKVGLLEDMISLFWEIWFCHMDLHGVGGMQLLLDSCVKTLETLWLYPSDGLMVRDFSETYVTG